MMISDYGDERIQAMSDDNEKLNDCDVPIKDDGYHWTWQQQRLWSAIRIIEISKERGWDKWHT